MQIDKPTLAKLKKFADAFKAARERKASKQPRAKHEQVSVPTIDTLGFGDDDQGRGWA
jgi:hypothetical protein